MRRLTAVRDRLFPAAFPVGAPGAPRASGVTEARRPVGGYVFFALVLLFYPVQQLLTQGTMYLRGQMWAEMATNYYATTQAMPWWRQLFATDAGYLPLPQRLLGIVGDQLALPASSIPYYYSGAAVLGTAVLVGVICLPVFRSVIANDGLRFALAIAILLIADFQTRTYINFTYFAIVPILFVAAWALLERDRQAPYWMWLLPVLMLSKPAVLTTLPFVVIAGVFALRRFRAIAAVSLVVGLVQLGFLVVSLQAGGSLYQSADAGPVAKAGAALGYFAGWLGRLVVGTSGVTATVYVVVGVVVLLALIALVVFGRSRASALVVGAVLTVLFGMLLNAVTFATVFTGDLMLLASDPLRWLAGQTFALLVLAAALVAALVELPALRRGIARAGERAGALRRLVAVAAVALFAGWFGLTGWVDVTASAAAPVPTGWSDVSRWQAEAPALAGTQEVVCIPIGPFGWVYGRDCGDLGAGPGTPNQVGFPEAAPRETREYTLELPEYVEGRELAAIGVVLEPVSGEGTVSGRVELTTASGRVVAFDGLAEVPSTGGLVQFAAPGSEPIADVVSARLVLDQAALVGTVTGPGGTAPAVLWMGR